MSTFYSILCLLVGIFLYQSSWSAPIQIVAAENFYGSVAEEIGGSYVEVQSIMNQPDQDPHLFNIGPSTTKRIGKADLIVFNGLGYDPWMQNLLSANTVPTRTVICVGQLLNKKEGANPHVWYDPATMPVYAKALLDYLSQQDPDHQMDYRRNYQEFLEKYKRLIHLIYRLKPRTEHLKVIATEPVFSYMAQALGFDMQGINFQISMMNGIDPSPRQILAFQNQLQTNHVRIVFYNKQIDSPLVQRLLMIAKTHAIPVVGVTEMQPAGKTFEVWMMEPLKKVEKILQ